MPNVKLRLENPKLILDQRKYAKGWNLTLETTLDDDSGQTLNISTDEEFSELLGSVILLVPYKGIGFPKFEKGLLGYIGSHKDIYGRESRSSFFVEIRLSDDDFDRIIDLVGKRTKFLSLTIDVPIEDWSHPDMDGGKWDNRAQPIVEVKGYQLRLDVSERA